MNLNDMTSKELVELIKNARKCLAAARLNEKSMRRVRQVAKNAMRQAQVEQRQAAKAERAKLKEIRVAERKAKAEARLAATEARLEQARQKVIALSVGAVGIKAKREAKRAGKVTVLK